MSVWETRGFLKNDSELVDVKQTKPHSNVRQTVLRAMVVEYVFVLLEVVTTPISVTLEYTNCKIFL